MNIVTISQLIDTHSLSELDAGAMIVTRLNELLTDEQKIDLDFTGAEIYQRYTELPSDLRIKVYGTEILNNAEAIELTNDVTVLIKHDRLIAQKDDEIKTSTVNWISVTLMLTVLVLCGFLLLKGYGLNIIKHTPLLTTVNKVWVYTYDYIVSEGDSEGP